MDVLQMHIEVKQRLQKVGLESLDQLFPEEIDLALNKARIRKIKSIFNQRFEDTELLQKYLAPIIVKNKSLTAYVPNTSENHYEDGMVYCVYPSNLLLLVNDRSHTVHNPCGKITDPTYTTINEYVAVVKFPTTNLSSPPYYSKVELNVAGNLAYSKSTAITGVGDSRYTFPIVNDILDTNDPSATGGEIYWETYRGVHYPNSLIIVSKDSGAAGQNVEMKIYQSNKTAVDASSSGNFATKTYREYTPPNNSEYVSKVVPNEKIDSSKIYNHIANPFYKPNHSRPLSTEATGLLYAYEGENFIITKGTVDYIRKPKQISLPLKQSCELSSAIHDEIIDLAVELLKLDIQDPTYSANVQESELRHQK